MFKFKSYSVKKAEENNDKRSKTSSSTATLKKTTALSTGTLKKKPFLHLMYLQKRKQCLQHKKSKM